MEKVLELANLYVATLRALYLIETNCHWLAKEDFYGNHLLFERIYQVSSETADQAAERMIGLLGREGANMAQQAAFLAKLLNKYQADDGNDLHSLCLQMEKDFLAFSQQVYDRFEEEGVLTLGLDDLIMSIASQHETSCYLLRQALEGDE